MSNKEERKPQIFIFCTRCSAAFGGENHDIVAVAEDGTQLSSHVCSSHGWGKIDMGVNGLCSHHDKYDKHYPNGFDVVWMESPPSSFLTHVESPTP